MKKWLICVGIIVSAMTSKVHAGETPTESTGYTQTKYPIVLVHSAFGFSQMFLFDYFHAIPEALTRDGADVHVTKLSPIHNMEVRGEQLLAQVEDIIAATGKEKVHLFGHSYGSPTARYVASVRPELVASVTSIGGANINIPIADAFRAIAKQAGLIEGVSALTVNSLAPLVTLLNDGGFLPSDLVALVDGATKEGFADFNQRHPQGLPTDCGILPHRSLRTGFTTFHGAVTRYLPIFLTRQISRCLV
ncbi:esterase/lipase family protein [Veronia nyctiphanis]|nr:alpha/beta fold hydrolase [Veronia nyctiphanis]